MRPAFPFNTVPILAAALLAAGCSSGDKAANSSGGSTTEAATQSQSQPDNLAADPGNMAVPVTPPSPRAVTAIPVGFRGRWAATPAACTGKGTGLVVTADAITLDGRRVAARSLTTLGDAALTMDAGPRAERLTLIDNGRTLVRQQPSPAAALTYLRCP